MCDAITQPNRRGRPLFLILELVRLPLGEMHFHALQVRLTYFALWWHRGQVYRR
jgi:hypothetical protein